MSKNKLSFGKRVLREILWFMCRAVSILPHWFRYYVLADIIFFLAYRCFSYRVKVVDKNLEKSFPEMSKKERRKIRVKYYHYLSEVMISTISLANDRAQWSIINTTKDRPVSGLKANTAGMSWVALTAHQGLWEYLMFWGEYADQLLIAVYHRLENPMFEELFQRLRKHKNVETVPIKEAIRYCLEHKDGVDGRNFVLGLIADQNPPRRSNSEWFKFLNQDSIFFDGGEKIALKLKLPVYFIYQRRLSRGRYELDYELIHDGVEEVEPYEITRRYIQKLEAVIRESPHLWLWSHRRWKHDPNKWKHKKQ